LSFIADLTVGTEVQRLVDSVLSRVGRIDILVNNAGMAQTGRPTKSKPLIETSFAKWQNQIAITLHTAFRTMRAVAIETGREGISINGVAPGWIATASSTEPEKIAALHTPLGRAGTPHEVAAAVCFLASPKPPTSPARFLWWMAATLCRNGRVPEARIQATRNLNRESKRIKY
jgi:3-oxoacyl-[acyl-carrier protein] reductase